MGSVNRFCHRAMLIERGNMVALGKPQEVADHYLALNFDREGSASAPGNDHSAAELTGSHEARILDAWTEDADGKRQNACPQGDRLRFKAAVAFRDPLEDPAFSVEIEDEWGTKILAATSVRDNERSGRFEAGEEVIFAVEFDNWLSPGKYFPTVNVSRRGGGLDLIHRRRRMSTITVFGSGAGGGVVDLPYVASIDRSAKPLEASRR
jgi:ABC-2 type transport system ATP-binding protein